MITFSALMLFGMIAYGWRLTSRVLERSYQKNYERALERNRIVFALIDGRGPDGELSAAETERYRAKLREMDGAPSEDDDEVIRAWGGKIVRRIRGAETAARHGFETDSDGMVVISGGAGDPQDAPTPERSKAERRLTEINNMKERRGDVTVTPPALAVEENAITAGGDLPTTPPGDRKDGMPILVTITDVHAQDRKDHDA